VEKEYAELFEKARETFEWFAPIRRGLGQPITHKSDEALMSATVEAAARIVRSLYLTIILLHSNEMNFMGNGTM